MNGYTTSIKETDITLNIDDIYQEVVLRLWKAFDRLNNNGKTRNFIITTTRNLLIDMYRERSVRPDIVSIEQLSSTEDGRVSITSRQTAPVTVETARAEDYSPEFLAFVKNALRGSKSQADILFALNDGWSISEYAKLQGKSVGTIKKQHYLAKQALKAHGQRLIDNSAVDFSIREDKTTPE